MMNENSHQYTWRRHNPTIIQSRLDYFLVTPNFASMTNTSDISAGYRSDHSLISLSLRLTHSKHGKGFWKFNTSLLRDESYVQLVKNTILDTVNEYKVGDNSNLETGMNFSISDSLFFDTLKLKIRGATIPFAARKKAERIKDEKSIQLEIERLEARINSSPSTELCEELSLKQEQLIDFRREKVDGSRVRARARWSVEGKTDEILLFFRKT